MNNPHTLKFIWLFYVSTITLVVSMFWFWVEIILFAWNGNGFNWLSLITFSASIFFSALFAILTSLEASKKLRDSD